MNANLIYPGGIYAWAPNREKGRYPLAALKVRVLSKTKRKEWGNENATTYVTVQPLPKDQQPCANEWEAKKWDGVKTIAVTSRTIVDHWDMYVGEREHAIDRRKEAQLKEKRKNLRNGVLIDLIQNHIAAKGLPKPSNYLTFDGPTIVLRFNTDEFLKSFGLTEAVIEERIDSVIEAMVQ